MGCSTFFCKKKIYGSEIFGILTSFFLNSNKHETDTIFQNFSFFVSCVYFAHKAQSQYFFLLDFSKLLIEQFWNSYSFEDSLRIFKCVKLKLSYRSLICYTNKIVFAFKTLKSLMNGPHEGLLELVAEGQSCYLQSMPRFKGEITKVIKSQGR